MSGSLQASLGLAILRWSALRESGHHAAHLRGSCALIVFAIIGAWCCGERMSTRLGDLMPEELALCGAELTWRAGPLRKGSGLCHGTAGNGFAFLKLLALTGDEQWLQRARHFAMHAIEQVERERDRVGRGRYTLFTGDIGVALYLRACLDGDPTFPTMDCL